MTDYPCPDCGKPMTDGGSVGYYCDDRKCIKAIARRLRETAFLSVSLQDLELLVKIAAREQRYKCVEHGTRDEQFMHHEDFEIRVRADIQNTPCPDVADVLKKWREAKEKK